MPTCAKGDNRTLIPCPETDSRFAIDDWEDTRDHDAANGEFNPLAGHPVPDPTTTTDPLP
ncbi:MAG: hypothetical protein HQL83_06225 [Magnetococcales bacterium]|nr:hypothetical protein [Magnetococcales bacterium]